MGEENFAAVEALYQAKGRLIFTLAYRLVNQRERAEDLVQEVFLLALTHQEAILHHPNQVGWLVQALKHLASNELRRAENRLTVPLEEDLLPASWPREALEELLPNGLSRQIGRYFCGAWRSSVPTPKWRGGWEFPRRGAAAAWRGRWRGAVC